MSEEIEELREWVERSRPDDVGVVLAGQARAALDEIDRLRARVAELEERAAFPQEAAAVLEDLEHTATHGGEEEVVIIGRALPLDDDAREDAPREPLYFIEDVRSHGELALWWRPDGRGYTVRLDEAGLYPEAEAKGIASLRGTDVPRDRSKVESIACRVVSREQLHRAAREDAQGGGK